jgi:hypothetical protein
MTDAEIFRIIQKYVENVPLILIGTGGTIPYGIPGMTKLAEYLILQFHDKYKMDSEWCKFQGRLEKGIDLESALTDLLLNEEILNDITRATWQLVTDCDLRLLNQIVLNRTILPLAKLISKFYQPHPQCVNIITTNYDRVIEYACDQFNIKSDTKFHGNYIKYFSSATLGCKNIVNILKVHGSLDLFKDKDNFIYSIPIQDKIPIGFVPEIIAPGSSKYRSVLQGTCRTILHYSDDLINNAQSFLCVGYGFNDEQIQTNIIDRIKKGKPIVVVTKEISDKSVRLIIDNSENYVIIQEGRVEPNSTEILINKERIYIDGTYWTVEGFMKIIE